MMKDRYFSLILEVLFFLLFLFLLFITMKFQLKDRMFPLIVIIPGLAFLVVQIIKDIISMRRKAEVKEEVKNAEAVWYSSRVFWKAVLYMYLSLLGIWLFGFIPIFFLVPLVIARFEGERWLTSISLALGCLIILYLCFTFLLKMTFYEGFLYSVFFG